MLIKLSDQCLLLPRSKTAGLIYIYFLIYLTGYGVAVDIWALGVILYILLCGFAPFRSRDRNQEELFQLIKQGHLNFLSPFWDHISEGAVQKKTNFVQISLHFMQVNNILLVVCVFVCRGPRPC